MRWGIGLPFVCAFTSKRGFISFLMSVPLLLVGWTAAVNGSIGLLQIVIVLWILWSMFDHLLLDRLFPNVSDVRPIEVMRANVADGIRSLQRPVYDTHHASAADYYPPTQTVNVVAVNHLYVFEEHDGFTVRDYRRVNLDDVD